MKKSISIFFSVVGFLAAVIAIWTFLGQRYIDGEIKIEIDEPVYWEAHPVVVDVKITKGSAVAHKYKVVVLQRNTREPGNIHHFQFEKLLIDSTEEAHGNIWFGTEEQGNLENFIVTAVVVRREIEFGRQSIHSIDDLNPELINQKIVSRDDLVAREIISK